MKKILLVVTLLAGIISTNVSAQSIERSVIASSGDFAMVGNISISFTIGEMAAVQTFLNPLMNLTQGFQQPDNWYTGIKTNTIVKDEFSAFPNPASEMVTVRFNGLTDGKLKLSLYNVLGQSVREITYTPQIGQTDYQIDLTGVAQGLYVLELAGTQYGKDFKKQDRLNVIY